MGMPAAPRFRADQRAAREDEAFLRVNVFRSGAGSIRREASLIVRMRPNLRQRTPEVPVFIVARSVMQMHDKIGIAADRLALFVLACVRMFMYVQHLF